MSLAARFGAILISDGFILIGAAATAYGAWLAFEPAGFMVGGSALAAFGWFVGGR